MSIKIFSDSQSRDSLGSKFRKRRFIFFKEQLNSIDKPIIKILDVGGTEAYWENNGFANLDSIHITLLNLEKQRTSCTNIDSIVGDATNLKQYNDNQFDICFSNSVIEHLYNFENQQKMAKETQRVGKYYFIQTPNKYFIIEPHFLLPFFQFFPGNLQHYILTKTKLSRGKKWNKKFAKNYINEIRLLSLNEMKELHPHSKFDFEKFIGLTKSFTAHNF